MYCRVSRLPSRRGATTAALHTAVAACATCWPSGPQSVCPTGAAAALVAALSTPSGGTTGEDHILMIHRSPPLNPPPVDASAPCCRRRGLRRRRGPPGCLAVRLRLHAGRHKDTV